MKNLIYLIALFSVVAFSSCSKEEIEPETATYELWLNSAIKQTIEEQKIEDLRSIYTTELHWIVNGVETVTTEDFEHRIKVQEGTVVRMWVKLYDETGKDVTGSARVYTRCYVNGKKVAHNLCFCDGYVEFKADKNYLELNKVIESQPNPIEELNKKSL